jgi:hypothetical protein
MIRLIQMRFLATVLLTYCLTALPTCASAQNSNAPAAKPDQPADSQATDADSRPTFRGARLGEGITKSGIFIGMAWFVEQPSCIKVTRGNVYARSPAAAQKEFDSEVADAIHTAAASFGPTTEKGKRSEGRKLCSPRNRIAPERP